MAAASRGIAQEIAAKKLAKVYAIESPKLAKYEPDGVVAALKDFIQQKQPTLVLMPHTYQVRDFAPQLATALQRTLISDAIGFHKDGGKLVFTRQMFQGKFAADVSFACPAPHFVTFQAGAFRGDKAEAGASAAPVETVNAKIADGVVSATSLKIHSRKPSRRSILLRRKSLSLSAAASKSRRTSNWPRRWPTRSAARLPRRVPYATPAGCPWTARSAAPDRPFHPSFISPSASAGPFSTLWG